MVTPAVDVLSVVVTFLAAAQPVLSSRTVMLLHSFGSMMALPLPPEIVTALALSGSTIGLAVPVKQTL
jgi:hypothetical protein